MDTNEQLQAITTAMTAMSELQQQNQQLLIQNQEQMTTIQQQNQALLEENQDLKSYIRERLNTIPMEVKHVLNTFIQEFKEAMAAKKPSDMSESIKELAKSMDNLRMKIEDTSTLQMTMGDKVLEAAEEIMKVKNKLPRHAPPKTVAQNNGSQPPQT